MDPLLSVRDLHVEFAFHGATIHALRGVSFDVRPGSTVALVGESGSGKSVTAQAIMGILPNIGHVTRGEVLLADPEQPDMIDLTRLDADGPQIRAIRGSRISMIFQEPMVSLSPLHTVGNQVSEALFLHRDVSRKEGLRLTEDMLRMVGFPDPHQAMKTYPFELSGGLRQRAMIAMALVCRPSLLIADEPTTALDVTIQAQILDLINELRRELGMAVLIITHDLGVVANMAEEVVVMYHGEVMEYGSIDDIFRHARHPYLQALLNAVPHFDMKAGERLVPVREVEHELGPMLRRKGATGADRGKAVLSVRDLNRTFTIRKEGFLGFEKHQTIKAVTDVSFDVLRGECFGLVGESGCGKTTVSKVIMRALGPDSGTIHYDDDGQDVDILALDENDLMRFRQKVQYIFQDPFSSLNPRMTVYDIVREPLVIHKSGDASFQAELVKELMRMVGLDPRFLNRYPHSFSGGQRQRIGIARALALSPDFIICDEPVSALDVSIQAQVLNLLKDLQTELGLTYLFISHNLAVVDYMATRIAVMCQGRIVEIAPREVLFGNPVHPYTRALLAAVPFADLDHPLDFQAVAQARTSEPSAWPAPFTIDQQPTTLIDLGSDHLVRAADDGSLRRTAA